MEPEGIGGNVTTDGWREMPDGQAVVWPDPAVARIEVESLRKLPPLVFAGEIRRLRDRLARAALGEAYVLIAGDCAESFDELRADRIRDQLKIIFQMALVVTHGGGIPIVKIGRMAGQFAKPRSSMIEQTPSGQIPTFRGHLVNSEFADRESRMPDPKRLVRGYNFSASMLNLVRAFTMGGFADLTQVHAWNQDFVAGSPAGARYDAVAKDIDRTLRFMAAAGAPLDRSVAMSEFFTAHEALVLDYESALTRVDSLTGGWYGCSARGISNPIGVKISDECEPGELVRLCRILDPDRQPGRLVLMSRMGAEKVRDRLPALVSAVRDAGFPVVWMCDPMHGNTRILPNGIKTRDFERIVDELMGFFDVVRSAGCHPGGVHLELTPEDVTECTGGSWATTEDSLEENYQSLCDPRLNGTQGLDLAFIIAERLRSG